MSMMRRRLRIWRYRLRHPLECWHRAWVLRRVKRWGQKPDWPHTHTDNLMLDPDCAGCAYRLGRSEAQAECGAFHTLDESMVHLLEGFRR